MDPPLVATVPGPLAEFPLDPSIPMTTWLEDLLLIPKQTNDEKERDSAREALKKSFENLVLDMDMWRIFLDVKFDLPQIQLKVHYRDFDDRLKVFKFGISCLLTFVQENFTGPSLNKRIADFLKSKPFKSIKFAHLLSCNNEEINGQTKYPQLLAAAKIIFDWCIIHTTINIWWFWRATYVHQRIIDELCPSLFYDMDRRNRLLSFTNCLKGAALAAMDIELGQFYLLFRHAPKAREHLIFASKLLYITFKDTGNLYPEEHRGPESLFQYMPDDNIEPCENSDNPQKMDTVVTTDEAVLPKVLPFDEDFCCSTTHSNLAQKLYLAMVQEKLFSQFVDTTSNQRVMNFIRVILAQKNTFCIRVKALTLRCKVDSGNKEKLKLAVEQCEQVLAAFKIERPEAFDRCQDVFATGFPAKWTVSVEYADLLLPDYPMTSMLFYIKLSLWEKVVDCYNKLDMPRKAADLVSEQLNKEPLPNIWCLLGEVTDDASCYQNAWELAKKRSHRVQRLWANYLIGKKKYADCIPHLQKSASINPLQPDVWLRLGHAGVYTGKWQTAATAYRRYITFVPDCFIVWTNLARSYIQTNNKINAHWALKNALAYNAGNWRTWEDLLKTSSELSMYADVIQSYHVVLDSVPSYLNEVVLIKLVNNIVHNTKDAQRLPVCRFKENAEKLLERVVSYHSEAGEMLELYAKVAPTPLLKVERYQKAYIAYIKDENWYKNSGNILQVLRVCYILNDLWLSADFDRNMVNLHSDKSKLERAFKNLSKLKLTSDKEPVESLNYVLDSLTQMLSKMSLPELPQEKGSLEEVD